MPPLDISDDMGGGGVPPTASKTAGLVSGAHGSMYSYFERPITARDSSRVAPTVESKPADDPSPRRDPAAEAALRAEALEGAAGMQSNAVSTTAWLGAWLEADTPRNCRKLLPKDGAFDETKTNIFAPEAQPDEKQGEAVKSRIEEMRALRQRQESEALAAKIAAIETSGPVAGVATALAPAGAGRRRRSHRRRRAGAAADAPRRRVRDRIHGSLPDGFGRLLCGGHAAAHPARHGDC